MSKIFLLEESLKFQDIDKKWPEAFEVLKRMHRRDRFSRLLAARWTDNEGDYGWARVGFSNLIRIYQMEKTEGGVTWVIGCDELLVLPRSCKSWMLNQGNGEVICQKWINGKVVSCEVLSFSFGDLRECPFELCYSQICLMAALKIMESLNEEAWERVAPARFNFEIFKTLKKMSFDETAILKISSRRIDCDPEEWRKNILRYPPSTGARMKSCMERIEDGRLTRVYSSLSIVALIDDDHKWPLEVTWQTRTGLMVIERWDGSTLEKLELARTRPLEIDLDPVGSYLDLLAIDKTLRSIPEISRWE